MDEQPPPVVTAMHSSGTPTAANPQADRAAQNPGFSNAELIVLAFDGLNSPRQFSVSAIWEWIRGNLPFHKETPLETFKVRVVNVGQVQMY